MHASACVTSEVVSYTSLVAHTKSIPVHYFPKVNQLREISTTARLISPATPTLP